MLILFFDDTTPHPHGANARFRQREVLCNGEDQCRSLVNGQVAHKCRDYYLNKYAAVSALRCVQ